MDKQLLFFLIIIFLFFLKGIASMSILLQLAGISMLILLIYIQLFNYKLNKKYEKKYVKKINFIGFLGNVDLALGVLLMIRILYGIVPLSILYFLSIILLLKALIFVWGGDIASILDICSVIIILSLGALNIPVFILIGVSIYLIQKGVLSFFS